MPRHSPARRFGFLAAMLALLVGVVAALVPASTATAGPFHSATEKPAVVPGTDQSISGLDAHDGIINKVGDTYYLYGTQYGTPYNGKSCQFRWLDPDSQFCGFGVWTSTDKINWTYHGHLFDPDGHNSWTHEGRTPGGESWQDTCVRNFGGGCFNPRMVQRGDGVWILWFNAPDDFRRMGANAYYAMGCLGPAGPCGDDYPGGTTHKPALSTCYGNGDFSIVNDAGHAYIACTMADQTLRIEQLDQWWTNGVAGAGLANLGGLTSVEAPAVFRAGNYLYLTYSDPNCGYCSGTGTSYLYSTTGMLGTWHRGFVSGSVAGPVSQRTCNGQPRSLSWIDGGIVLWIDQWQGNGAPNQTTAPIQLEPLHVDPAWQLEPLPC